jgi:ABC-type dipeptide/oligopeptide/nickel transport system permease subunit
MSKMSDQTIQLEIPKLPRQKSEFMRILGSILRSRTAVFGGLVLGLYIIIAIFAPVLIRHDPNQQNLDRRLAPPIGLDWKTLTLNTPWETIIWGVTFLAGLLLVHEYP